MSFSDNTEVQGKDKENPYIMNELVFLLNHGIEGFKNKILKEADKKEDIKEKLYSLIQQDKSLRFPHRKIMVCLIENYDYTKKEFKEINFSRLVKEAKIGKNKAREYLELLLEKGLLKQRTDGYRKMYRVKKM